MIERLENGNVFISKGTPIPFLCPKCEAIVPYKKSSIVKCWACDFESCFEDFNDVEFVLRGAM